jgi:hypothetical protein
MRKVREEEEEGKEPDAESSFQLDENLDEDEVLEESRRGHNIVHRIESGTDSNHR